ncbi:pyridoxamine 5'-phosphate oxidase family protein [Pseudonocardia halophobica]|uniref:pyridoxamine 5'-phosphate oxidase family protein n=1 Tax=Pseudonocardia halophobica TaxID=29401 RepID=UPI003D8FD248
MTDPLLGPQDAATAARLAHEPILWLSTVDRTARPHTAPVWFLFADPRIVVFSRPDTAKVGRMRRNPAVGFSLDSAAGGTDIVLGEGDATLAGADDVVDDLAPFEEKYHVLLGAQSFAEWLRTFSQPVVVTVTKIVSWRPGPGGLDHRRIV